MPDTAPALILPVELPKPLPPVQELPLFFCYSLQPEELEEDLMLLLLV